ncbi:MAG: nuclear transport factor 2 family protein [Dokdonella sp.]
MATKLRKLREGGWAIVLSIVSGASAVAADVETETKAQLLQLTQELMDAVPAGKADVWQRILADVAMLVDEYGRRQDKAEIVESIHPFPQGFSGSIEIRDPAVRVQGDVAVLNGEFYERETVFDQKLVVRYIFSNTFVRRDGAWKLLAANDVTLPTPPPVLAVADLKLDDYPGVYSYGPGRAFTIARDSDTLFYTTKAGGRHTDLEAVAKDVFMDGGDEKSLIVFRRNARGAITELIERRKYNDLHLVRADAKG